MAVFEVGATLDTLSNPDLFEVEGRQLTFTICGVKRKRRSVH